MRQFRLLVLPVPVGLLGARLKQPCAVRHNGHTTPRAQKRNDRDLTVLFVFNSCAVHGGASQLAKLRTVFWCRVGFDPLGRMVFHYDNQNVGS